MSQVIEIKCPNCGKWTLWNEDIDDRCLYCNEFLEPQRFSREVEKKIAREVKKENDYFAVKASDGPFNRRIKNFLNSFRWMVYYVQIVFFTFITLLLVLLSLLTG